MSSGFVRGPGHTPNRGGPEIWADVLHLECTTCGAPVDSYCSLKVNSTTYAKHSPCLSRLKAAEKAS